MVRKNSKRRGRARQSMSRFSPFIDTFASSVAVGSSLNFTRATFEFPKDRAFYISKIYMEAGVAGGTTTSELSTSIQIRVMSVVRQDFVWTSGPILVGTIPYRRTFSIPKADIVWPRDTPVDASIVAIDAVCLRKGSAAIINVVVKFDVMISPEQVNESCPTLTQTYLHRLPNGHVVVADHPLILDLDSPLDA